MVVVNTCQRIDSNCSLGSLTSLDLYVNGDSYHRRAKVFKLGNALLNCIPGNIFDLEPNNYHKIQLKARFLHIGKRYAIF